MKPRFEPLASTSGLAVIDPIESRRFSLLTPEVVSQSPADPGDFHFPVSSACSIRTSEIELPYTISVYVRQSDGTMVTGVEPPMEVSLPKDEYLIELSSPVKIYLEVESGLEIESGHDTLRASFGDETTLTVGARSRHKSPAGTITVPDDPEQMMQAISVLSSSLKTTSPERSFPTLRGHPPKIERGDELNIPDDFSRPETGVTIEVPPEYKTLYPVAPLAFYLGAELIPGSVPKLTTDTGFEYHLDSHRGFEAEVERVLKQTFFLDCVVRTEGYYPINLAEREVVELRLNLDFATLYDRSLAERTEAYLGVPYETIEDVIPTWYRTTFVRPEAENIELLPYIVNDLSSIQTPSSEEAVTLNEEADGLWEEIDEFQRGSPVNASDVFRSASKSESPRFTRTGRSRNAEMSNRNYVSIPESDTIEQAWAGRGTPTNGTKLLSAAYEQERTVLDDGIIDITVVCNDSRMRREWDTVSEIYGSRDELSIETTIEFGVGKAKLRNLLQESADLFHYIGHVDDRGFDCVDGFLDAKTLDEVGTKSFILNACDSHDQGEGLIEAGASAGIVSLSEVGNRSAIEIGAELARLFHHGFSLGTALNLIREYTASGSRYIGLGDIGLMLIQNEDSNTLFYKILESDDENLTVAIYSCPNRDYPLGSFVAPFLIADQKRYLHPMEGVEVKTSRAEFKRLLEGNMIPVIFEESISWGDTWLS